MIAWVLGMFGVCLHPRVSWPQSPRGGGQARVSCLECGREFEYDWDEMRIGEER